MSAWEIHLEKLTGCKAALRPEPNNEYDPNAVAVDVLGIHVGYLPKTWRESFAPETKAACERILAGEGKLLADLVQFVDQADEPRWTVRVYGEFE